ncbi:MAG: Hemerythrin cation binding domain protein [Bacteroidetes bacterium]|nr:Hemerythrin cation binding domain protein [Bacteroidota bacterium]
MFKQHKFSETDKMSDLINENHSLLLVISRFGLSLGFGDHSVKEVCAENGIDCRTFLAVVNFLTEANFEVEHDYEDISIGSLINYLKNAHVYFLEFKLPQIRNKLIEAVSSHDQNIPYLPVFLKFFDEYVSEVRKHMEYEDKVAFPYVIRLLNDEPGLTYNISVFRHRHNEIESKLVELKNILVKYYPDKGNNPLLTEVLFDVFSCEMDLATHSQVEDFLFIPAVEAVEHKRNQKK